MRHTPPRRERRFGFTLIEMVVVLAINVVLASLTAAAVMKAAVAGPQVRTRSEIGELETAVQNVVQTYHLKYLPSRLKLNESNNYPQRNTPGTDDFNTVTFLQRMFGRRIYLASGGIDWNGDGTIQTTDFILE